MNIAAYEHKEGHYGKDKGDSSEGKAIFGGNEFDGGKGVHYGKKEGGEGAAVYGLYGSSESEGGKGEDSYHGKHKGGKDEDSYHGKHKDGKDEDSYHGKHKDGKDEDSYHGKHKGGEGEFDDGKDFFFGKHKGGDEFEGGKGGHKGKAIFPQDGIQIETRPPVVVIETVTRTKNWYAKPTVSNRQNEMH
jgi:hypothetical protein